MSGLPSSFGRQKFWQIGNGCKKGDTLVKFEILMRKRASNKHIFPPRRLDAIIIIYHTNNICLSAYESIYQLYRLFFFYIGFRFHQLFSGNLSGRVIIIFNYVGVELPVFLRELFQEDKMALQGSFKTFNLFIWYFPQKYVEIYRHQQSDYNVP